MPKGFPRNKARKRIHRRLRYRLLQGSKFPRLNVFRSLKHVYAQVIEDSSGRTLTSISSLDKELQKKCNRGSNIAAAQIVGQAIAESCLSTGIQHVVFDRGGYPFHGRVKALAEAARKEGLKF